MYRLLTKYKKRLFVFIILILLFLFGVVPSAILFYLFDATKIKNQITKQFDTPYYSIVINGNITPEFLHGFSIKIDDVSIIKKHIPQQNNVLDNVSKPSESQPHTTINTKNTNPQILHIGSIKCDLSWPYLAFAQFKIDTVNIKDLDINENLILNHGLNHLLNQQNIDHSMFTHLHKLSVDHIKTIGNNIEYPINDGTLKVSLLNVTPHFTLGFRLTKSNTYVLTTGNINDINNNIIDFNKFSLHAYNSNLNIDLISHAKYLMLKNQLILNNLKAKVKLPSNSSIVTAKKLAITNNKININKIKAKLNFSNKFGTQKLQAMIHQISINPTSLKILMDKLHLDYLVTVEDNTLQLKSTLSQITADKNFNLTSNNCKSHLKITANKILTSPLNSSVSGFCEYVHQNQLLNLRLHGSFENSPVKIDLQLLMSKPKPKLVIAGKFTNLDLSRVEVNKDKIMPFYYDDSDLPFKWLSLIDMNANLAISHLTLDRIHLQNVLTDFNVHNNRLSVKSLKANIYNGSLTAFGSITKHDNGYDIKTHQLLKNLNLQNMFKDLFDVTAISGNANLYMNVTAKNVISYNDLHKNLNGNINISANHGAFAGVNFDLLADPTSSSYLTAPKFTVFNKLKAHFRFVDGISKHSTLSFYSPTVITSGHGIIDFINTTLDYKLMIKSILPRNRQKISGVTIPVTATGDLFNPQITIQNIHLLKKNRFIRRKRTTHKKHH